MWINLLFAAFMVAFCVITHFLGLVLLLRLLRRRAVLVREHNHVAGHAVMLVSIVVGIMIVHSVEIWAYMFAYLSIGAIERFYDALYFSIATFSTVGDTNNVLAHDWRLFAVTESVVGPILFGWSTAFLISVMDHMRTFEHHWLDEPGNKDKT